MPYGFNFDLARIPKAFFKELVIIAYKGNVYTKMGERARSLVKKFKISEIIGLDPSDAITLVEDLIMVYAKNIEYNSSFRSSRKRAVFLPHCARKYMDGRCKATFDPSIPSYICNSCSEDCLVNQAIKVARARMYDVYVVPGGSCIPKILQKGGYDGMVGVGCSQELKMGVTLLERSGVSGQGIPLIRNGCANTKFEIETLISTLQ
ncbi:MAG: DUF116 domain-containing protein [Nitrososphaeria archaeon]